MAVGIRHQELLHLERRQIGALRLNPLQLLRAHISAQQTRHELHQQHNADQGERIGDAIAHRDGSLLQRLDAIHGIDRGGQGGCVGQRAGEQPGSEGVRETEGFRHDHRRHSAGADRRQSRQDEAAGLAAEGAEEARPGLQADGVHEQEESQFRDRWGRLEAEMTEYQRDEKHRGRAERDSFDGNLSEPRADREDDEQAKNGFKEQLRHQESPNWLGWTGQSGKLCSTG